MYYYMQKAKGVYSTHISESPLFAGVLGKFIEAAKKVPKQRRSFYCRRSKGYR